MGTTYSANLIGTDLNIAIVASRWNDLMVNKLIEGAKDTLMRHGVDEGAIDLALVPGCFELSLAARKMADSGKYDAIVCLGAVIRGGTPHFEYVAGEAARGISQVSATSGVPVSFGVLTCDTIEQAIERSGSKGGNKGVEAALAAIEMANLIRMLPESE
jgi:6,7-dimethyl-8-ribityllumazine synthase